VSKRSDWIGYRIPKLMVQAIDKFLESDVAKKNGVFSRSDFITRVVAAWLANYEKDFQLFIPSSFMTVHPPLSPLPPPPTSSHTQSQQQQKEKQEEVVLNADKLTDDKAKELIDALDRGWILYGEMRKMIKEEEELHQRRLKLIEKEKEQEQPGVFSLIKPVTASEVIRNMECVHADVVEQLHKERAKTPQHTQKTGGKLPPVYEDERELERQRQEQETR
jgi:hypothetical protein